MRIHTETYIGNDYIPRMNSGEVLIRYLNYHHDAHIYAFIHRDCKRFLCKCMQRIVSFSFSPPLFDCIPGPSAEINYLGRAYTFIATPIARCVLACM